MLLTPGTLIRPEDDAPERSGYSVLLYGAPGAGKTTTAAAMALALDRRALLVDVDHGRSVVPRGWPVDRVLVRQDTAGETEGGWADLVAAYQIAAKGEHGVLVLDTLTIVRESIGLQLIQQLGKGGDPDRTSQDDWVRLNRRMMRLVRTWKALAATTGAVVVLTAHEKQIEADGGLVWIPALGGALPGRVGATVDAVWRMARDGDGQRLLLTDGTATSAAKTRRLQLPKILGLPDDVSEVPTHLAGHLADLNASNASN